MTSYRISSGRIFIQNDAYEAIISADRLHDILEIRNIRKFVKIHTMYSYSSYVRISFYVPIKSRAIHLAEYELVNNKLDYIEDCNCAVYQQDDKFVVDADHFLITC